MVAERTEPFADHHFGKADDGIDRRAHLMADPRQHLGFAVCRAVGLPLRRLQLAFALPALRQIAKYREEIRTPGTGPSHGHRERDNAALAHASQHVTTVIEQARSGGARDAGEIVGHHGLAFRREQCGEIARHELGAVVTE